jgi:hypothetical protein
MAAVTTLVMSRRSPSARDVRFLATAGRADDSVVDHPPVFIRLGRLFVGDRIIKRRGPHVGTMTAGSLLDHLPTPLEPPQGDAVLAAATRAIGA